MMMKFLGIIGLFLAGMCQAQDHHWKEFVTPVKASLRGLSPVSDQVCWASGSGGTWLRTTDGGKSWDHGVIEGLDTVDFRSIHAFDENIAVAASAGQPAVIFRTENGGKSWEKVHQEGPLAFFDGMAFFDEERGYVIGDPVDGFWMILEALDGGKSWKSLENLPLAEEGEAAFAASGSSMITTENSLIFGTGGLVSNLHFYDFTSKNWEKVKTPILQGEASQGIFAIAESENGIFCVGGDYTKLELREKNAFKYSGKSFQIPSVAPLGYRSGLTYDSETGLFVAVGPSGSDYSADMGNHWANFSSTGYHTVKASYDGKSIWASGSGGRVGILIQR
ncbi:WD40/YVTN/BNR-like repeat-containing protein [Algoriphagus sp.]|uniref:WD40/YVTN/BNR-like repeat-containing protein n=1 Tax=Algoriphagus sp. TaxID=1872435 RepID=UPI003919E1F2